MANEIGWQSKTTEIMTCATGDHLFVAGALPWQGSPRPASLAASMSQPSVPAEGRNVAVRSVDWVGRNSPGYQHPEKAQQLVRLDP